MNELQVPPGNNGKEMVWTTIVLASDDRPSADGMGPVAIFVVGVGPH